MTFEAVTPNVFTDTTIRGCNPSYVVTSEGTVIVDTPQMPSKAVAMRKEAEAKGPIQYVINTEHHVDHIFGNYYFKGAGKVIHHQGLADNFMLPTPLLDPFDYAAEGTQMSGPRRPGDHAQPRRLLPGPQPRQDHVHRRLRAARGPAHVQPDLDAGPHARPASGPRAGRRRRLHR
jgi:glyoxylase-like metal-dependent hydrolase (beta-lactamase superfamily II)